MFRCLAPHPRQAHPPASFRAVSVRQAFLRWSCCETARPLVSGYADGGAVRPGSGVAGCPQVSLENPSTLHPAEGRHLVCIALAHNPDSPGTLAQRTYVANMNLQGFTMPLAQLDATVSSPAHDPFCTAVLSYFQALPCATALSERSQLEGDPATMSVSSLLNQVTSVP